jgi:hypothetical protein
MAMKISWSSWITLTRISTSGYRSTAQWQTGLYNNKIIGHLPTKMEQITVFNNLTGLILPGIHNRRVILVLKVDSKPTTPRVHTATKIFYLWLERFIDILEVFTEITASRNIIALVGLSSMHGWFLPG